MKQTTGFYPRPRVDTAKVSAVGQAGGVLLTGTVRAAGLDVALSGALARWRKPLAVHDPGKVITDLAISLASGGDCLADVAVLRAEPAVYGRVASDPTISRTIAALAKEPGAVLAAIDLACAAARAAVWGLAGQHAPDHKVSAKAPLVIDLDATLVTAHAEKEQAAPTFKRGFGFHPLWAFADHGPAGTGEPLAVLLRAGNAGSNTAADHISVTRQALAQLPGHRPGIRPGRKVLIRVDGAGSTHKYLKWLAGQRLSYSVGFSLPDNTPDLLALIPDRVWAPALDAHDEIRDGAWVAELTSLLNLTNWPPGMRVIARKERPHPGAQLRITDVDGLRVTAFATNTTRGQLPDLELLHGFDQNQIWCAIVALAVEITAWMQMLTLTSDDATSATTTSGARRWEPKRLRHRLFTAPAALTRTGRRIVLHLSDRAPWAHLVLEAVTRLRALTAPG